MPPTLNMSRFLAAACALVVGASGGAAVGACGGATSGAVPGEPGDPPGDRDDGDGADGADLGGAALGLHAGEQMTFEVALAGVPVAQAAFAVGEPGTFEGRPAIVVSSTMRTDEAFRWVKDVRDDLTSTIDIESGLPVAIVADVEFGDKLYYAEGRFAGARVHLAWDRRDGKTRHTRYDFGDAPAHDAHSAMAAMRTWDGRPGDRRTVYIVGGRRIWRTEMTWVGRETIGSRLGNQHVVRLDGVSTRVTRRLEPEPGKPPRTFQVWLTDDGDRAPLRVVATTELGDVTIDLTGYQRP